MAAGSRRPARLAALGVCLLAGSGALLVDVALVAPGCRSGSDPVVIDLDDTRHARVLDHAWDAIAAGQPALLHVDREGADENRRQSLRGIPTRAGHDRDEYPPAVSREGGAGADVRYVPSSENRSAGSRMGRQLRGWCEGQVFTVEKRPPAG